MYNPLDAEDSALGLAMNEMAQAAAQNVSGQVNAMTAPAAGQSEISVFDLPVAATLTNAARTFADLVGIKAQLQAQQADAATKRYVAGINDLIVRAKADQQLRAVTNPPLVNATDKWMLLIAALGLGVAFLQYSKGR